MTEINENEILDEIMGTFVRPNTGYTRPYESSPRISDPNIPENQMRRDADIRVSGPNVRNCNTLEGWQRQIINNLSSQNDEYIIARPGGGKTLPIICYWTDKMLGLNTTMSNVNAVQNQNIKNSIGMLFSTRANRVNVSKVLILVPVITLAQQTAMELRRDLASIMMQVYNNSPDTYLRDYLTEDNNIKNLYLQRKVIMDEITRLNGLAGGPINRETSNLPRLQQNLAAINKNLVTLVEKYISTMVNSLVYLRTGSHRPQTKLEDAIVFVSIYESAPSFIKEVKNLELVVVDEAHLSQESGIKHDDVSRAYQISGGLFNVLDRIKDNSRCRLVFLTGTINPTSAAKLTKYLNDCFNRKFSKSPTVAPPEASNRSLISITTNESINTPDGIIKNIIRSVNQRDWGQLYVIFSTHKINNIVEECIKNISIRDIENISPGGYEFDSAFAGLGSQRQSNDIKLSNLDRLSIPPGTHLQVANITNPLLRQAVLRGIGFIYRNIEVSNPLESGNRLQMNDTDKTIVAKLFKERKLSVLLATDAVGIGVNIDVKDLYIPAIEKYSDEVKNLISVSLRDLAQILNRAGRGATPIASIHTPGRNVEMVTNALYMNPEDLPDVDEIRKLGINPCHSKYFSKLLSRIRK